MTLRFFLASDNHKELHSERNMQQSEQTLFEGLVEALEVAKAQKTPKELMEKYAELLDNLETNTQYTR